MASNCLGGILSNILGLKFASPWVNVLISSKEFVRYIVDFDYYMALPLVFMDTNKHFPVARLGDLTLNFVHYGSREEAEAKWKQRKIRINKSCLYFLLNDCDGITDEDLSRLDASPFQNIVVFTSHPYSNHRCTFFLPPFAGQPCVGNTMNRSWFSGKVLIEEYFDFVGWLNQEKGTSLESYRI